MAAGGEKGEGVVGVAALMDAGKLAASYGETHTHGTVPGPYTP